MNYDIVEEVDDCFGRVSGDVGLLRSQSPEDNKVDNDNSTCVVE